MVQNFTGKTALITGAASGIGLALARHLATHGIARLILCDIDGEALAAVAGDISGPGVDLHPGDVADEAYWDALEPTLTELHFAVANAGIADSGRITDFTLDRWRRVLGVNLDGVFLTLRAAMRAMSANGGGSIVLTGSAAGLKAEPGIAAYAASKAGVHHLARVAAKEGAPLNIRVNAIAPGGVATPIWRSTGFFNKLVVETGSEKAAFAVAGKVATPLGRYAEPDEIAAQIAFLLSGACATVTGTLLKSDGGYSL